MGKPNSTGRKQYTITKQREKWTDEEHKRFCEAIDKYGRAWRDIVAHVGTRTVAQVRSHAQKHFLRLEKEGKGAEVPPARPKKRSARHLVSGSAPAKAQRVCRHPRLTDGPGGSSNTSSLQETGPEGAASNGDSGMATSMQMENSMLSNSALDTATGMHGLTATDARASSTGTLETAGGDVMGPVVRPEDVPLPIRPEGSSTSTTGGMGSAFAAFGMQQPQQRRQLLHDVQHFMQQLAASLPPGAEGQQGPGLAAAGYGVPLGSQAMSEALLLHQQQQQHSMLVQLRQQMMQDQWRQQQLAAQERQWSEWQAQQQQRMFEAARQHPMPGLVGSAAQPSAAELLDPQAPPAAGMLRTAARPAARPGLAAGGATRQEAAAGLPEDMRPPRPLMPAGDSELDLVGWGGCTPTWACSSEADPTLLSGDLDASGAGIFGL